MPRNALPGSLNGEALDEHLLHLPMNKSALRPHKTDTTSVWSTNQCILYLDFHFQPPHRMFTVHTQRVSSTASAHIESWRHVRAGAAQSSSTWSQQDFSSSLDLLFPALECSGCYWVTSGHTIADQLFLGPGYPCSSHRLRKSFWYLTGPSHKHFGKPKQTRQLT